MKSSSSAAYPREGANPEETGRNLSKASLAKVADIVALAIHQESSLLRQEISRQSKLVDDLTKRLNRYENKLGEREVSAEDDPNSNQAE